ncbi:energy transducer TonB [Leptospira brenneri]|uniref:Energy transducer TonB n=1 Tax=Leptospira brenneri TaxID=2023182 RepID=A0A2M9Y420_9LEPT|nr:energy transducer TonB [Leptospira brenneri]PJZ46173.1 energy transducer TonB [Leptospira brenneri]TGK96267.1 energy transducer TonB [Leptospira brenneri]
MNGTVVTQRRSKRERIHRFIDRYRIETGLAISAFVQAIIILFWFTPHLETDSLDSLVEEVAFIDNVQIQEPSTDSKPTDGDFDLTDKEKEEKKEDPRIAGASDPIVSGATSPVDLSPNIRPEYTSDAKALGLTGTMTLEVIIGNTGEVLRVRSVGKQLGGGLEEEAIKVYRRKRFSPSILEGKAITVKVLVPIRFTLN